MSSAADTATLYLGLKSQFYTAAASLFFNGICLLLFSLAVYFLVQTKTFASRYIFLPLSVIFVLFALAQVIIDVYLAVLFTNIVETTIETGTVPRSTEQAWVNLYTVREAATVTNNALADCLFLYRCAVIWGASPYSKVIITIPAFLILATMTVGYVATFANTNALITVPYPMALATNFVLLGLTAGRIWHAGREATVLFGAGANRRYNAIIAIVCESSLLYVIVVLIYMVTLNTGQEFSPLYNISWGALAQVVNIVPMMVIVRVGMTKNFSDERASGTRSEGTTVRVPLLEVNHNEPRKPDYRGHHDV
ncbi:hypothetical protein C8R44DRAFT_992455 [Mycena epipterygia]|nr:hypothetical protein C8R44DRAFT_992455 [Mycena epipterygia]